MLPAGRTSQAALCPPQHKPRQLPCSSLKNPKGISPRGLLPLRGLLGGSGKPCTLLISIHWICLPRDIKAWSASQPSAIGDLSLRNIQPGKFMGWSCCEGGVLKQTGSMYFSLSVQCSNVTAPCSLLSKLCFISNSEVSCGESKVQESCLEKEWELQIPLFIKDILGDNEIVMKD